ncbi:MAG: hypothetical protein P4L53_08775 [Candidatus Obscuribacterales bacterium]|nr:hypothetical protein [Candidatus Obscuribacterales bacterium]
MNRTFATVCLSLLAALAVPCVLITGFGLWTVYPHVLRMAMETVPLSFLLGGLTTFFWLCGPPQPTNLIEAIGRWFLALLMPVGMAFVATALPAMIDTTVNHTNYSALQIFWIEFHSFWGLLCGVAAGLVLQYRESTMKVPEVRVPEVKVTGRRGFLLK